MKRFLSLLTLSALLFALAACAQKTPAQSDTPTVTPPTEAKPIALAQLNVEFVKGERDAEALLTLKKELPPLLIDALKAEGVSVDAVSVTFGASAEATAQALAAGSVHVAFLPTSVYCAHFGEIHAVAERVGSSDSLIGLYLPYSEHNASLVEKLTSVAWEKAFSKEDLTEAQWALPALDEAAERYLSLLLEQGYDLSPDELENVSSYSDLAERDAALKNANFVVLYGSDAVTSPLYATLTNLPLEGETVAVTAAESQIQSEAFCTALQNALSALCLDEASQKVLALYSGGEFVNYRAVNDGTYSSQRYILGHEE